MDMKYQEFIGTALSTLVNNNAAQKEQRIKTDSFIGIVRYLNESDNWKKVSEGWKNISGHLLITNGRKGFILHRIH